VPGSFCSTSPCAAGLDPCTANGTRCTVTATHAALCVAMPGEADSRGAGV
jgi:hypothetical protein